MIKPFRKLIAGKGKPTAAEWNRLTRTVEHLASSLVRDGIIDSSGILARRVSSEGGANIKLARIVSAASGDGGDGIYDCYELTLDATEWGDTQGDSKFDDKDAVSFEVMNLYENDCISAHFAALGLYDRIMCWKASDDESNSRWIGVPLTSQIRIVYADEAAPATDVDTTSVTCNLQLNNGVEAVSGELGYNIEVYGSCVGGTADWDEVIPRIANNDKLTAQWANGTWNFTTEFIPSEDCVCS